MQNSIFLEVSAAEQIGLNITRLYTLETAFLAMRSILLVSMDAYKKNLDKDNKLPNSMHCILLYIPVICCCKFKVLVK